MTILKIDSIETRLRQHQPRIHEINPGTRQAAVATIIRERQGQIEALFILRATHEDDPWSGHMAFPGGHMDPEDTNLQKTAERETLEEIGLDLGKAARLIGAIDPVRANPRGRNLDMLVAPYVYLLEEEAEFSPNYEVADILWGSLNDMHSGQSLAEREFQVSGEWQSFTGYDVGEQLVWGLTYRMLDLFFGILDPAWQPKP